MKFYNIKDEYINYLKKYDAKVVDNKKGKRPYVGVVLEIDGIKYYTPFTSPKEKHRKMKNTKDFRKINQGIYGAINFNDIDAMEDSKYQRLLQNQYKCIKADREQIQLTAKRLRDTLFKKDEELNGNDKKIKERCCDLPLLEEVVKHYGNH